MSVCGDDRGLIRFWQHGLGARIGWLRMRYCQAIGSWIRSRLEVLEQSTVNVVVVIPTRNRPDLAITAIESVLTESAGNLSLLVSDNATSEAAHQKLAAYCNGVSDPRLILVSPPEHLSMAAHWEWAMNQALRNTAATHLIYLTDRSLFKPGELAKI